MTNTALAALAGVVVLAYAVVTINAVRATRKDPEAAFAAAGIAVLALLAAGVCVALLLLLCGAP